MRTLDELNAATADQELKPVLGRYLVTSSYAVATAARHNRRQYAGAKMHLAIVETIVSESGDHRPGTLAVGDHAAVTVLCGVVQGQHQGRPLSGIDTDAINCTRCAARVAS